MRAKPVAGHPGIVYRDGEAGRRAALAGHRIDVWMVIETVQEEGGDVAAAATYLSVDVALVQAAVDYYVEHRTEIDRWIEENDAMAQAFSPDSTRA